ncbi:MAG: helix-turn-helix domain-containing protein [Alsobacter sp.]
MTTGTAPDRINPALPLQRAMQPVEIDTLRDRALRLVPSITRFEPLRRDTEAVHRGVTLQLGPVLLGVRAHAGLLLEGDGPLLNLYLPFTPGGRLEAGSRSLDLDPRTPGLLARSQRLRFIQGEQFASVYVVVPEATVAARMAAIGCETEWPHAARSICLDPALPGLTDLRALILGILARYEAPDWLPGARKAFDTLHGELIVTTLAEVVARAAASGHAPPAPGSATLDRARAFIAARLGEPLTPAAIARASGISVRGLHYEFTRRLNVSVSRYVKLTRLDAARQLIEAGGSGVSEAALACGFTHMGDFSAAFRARFGIRPSDLLRG